MKRLLLPLVLLPVLAGGIVEQADAQWQMPPVKHSSTSVVLPCFPLWDISASPEGSAIYSGVTNATAGLEIKVRTNVTDGWEAEYSQSGSTINAISGTIGTFETPDANDAHFEEIASGAGCYQLILADATWSVANANEVSILIRDSSSPDFADQWVVIDLNVADLDDIGDTVWDEPKAGHTGTSTFGDLATDLDAVLDDTGTTGVEIADDAVDSSSIADSGITSAKLASGAITADAIAADAIGASELAAAAIGASEIATDAIGAAELAADAIGASELALNAIGSSELAISARQAIVDELMAEEIGSGTIDYECYQEIKAAYASGKWNLSGGIVTYRDVNDTTDIIVGTITSTSFENVTITCP